MLNLCQKKLQKKNVYLYKMSSFNIAVLFINAWKEETVMTDASYELIE